MVYNLKFLPSALKEWKKLPSDARSQFYKKLEERLKTPRIPSPSLSGMQDCYKIKLKSLGYRLVYRVYDKEIIVEVIAIGKRDKSEVYDIAKYRLH